MHELLAQIFAYMRGMWRYRWVALIVAWAIALGGWYFVAKMPDRYQASARVFVDTNSILRPLLQGLTVQPDLVQRVDLMSKMLLNQETLDRVARASDMDVGIKNDNERTALLARIKNKIALQGERTNPSMYSVTFEHTNPQQAKRVVQALMDIFIDEALISDQRASSTAKNFLDQEIQEYENRLTEAERKLADFKRQYVGLMPGSESDYYGSLDKQKTALADAELALREAIQRRDAMAAEIELQELASETSMIENTASEEELTDIVNPQITALEQRLNALLLHYTEKHPAVIDLRRLIKELRQQLAAKAPAKKASKEPSTMSADTVYGSLRVALSEADAQVAALNARVEDQTKKVENLSGKIDSIPNIEAELKRLNRDYTTVAAQYAELIGRRETARLSQQVEKTSEGVRFRVIDPPAVPSKPSAPNRKIFNIAVLIVAIGAGMALALLIDLLRPIFDDSRTLYRHTHLPVFGVVSFLETRDKIRQKRLTLIPFLLLTIGLFIMSAAVMILPLSSWVR
ncbi:chain length-determining protein [Rhodoferax sp. 4810]|uniref:Chain length-determining protein n=1 Tax=Thiospirillum jenense TaxID=1653858 RepID=A0A839HKD5_9GAMM|nr:XrtA system polysaccharide chain length determinant [Thiospirillum jenense]MBB1077086.1 chain length-determining protein [Rhodoferax jenense]MBB1127178.1 chain length-determining protein [Thiospirillum jenense]